MSLKESLKLSAYIFVVGVFGLTVGFSIYTKIFLPVHPFNYFVFDQILLIAALCGLTGFVYYSKKDISNFQMGVRIVIHLLLVIGIVLSLGARWRWIMPSPLGWVIFTAFIILSFFVALLVSGAISEKVAKQLNASLRKRRNSK